MNVPAFLKIVFEVFERAIVARLNVDF